ncbi:MAG: adenine-specific methyltransferase EcoRI family protein [Anaerolineae bacterium]|nr:adenine-specific methyltransferase EcoRI family protein [Anaerolineae bacterium]
MANSNLTEAQRAKNDEFYTQYHDIEKEISAYLEFNPDVFRGKTLLLPCDDPEWSNFTKYFAQNFDRFGLKKLISTSYAVDSKTYKSGYQPSLFETSAPYFDQVKTVKNGKIFSLTHDKTGDRKVDVDDLEWHYLNGDGDFRSAEIKKLRDEADIIITNPPFSLFRDFLAWIFEAEKQFLIIGNMNAISYKEVFSLIKENKLWLGATGNGSDMVFAVPAGSDVAEGDKQKAARLGYVGDYTRLGNSCWFTNLDHGRRHKPLPLMTMADNLKYSKHKEIKGKQSYDSYDNYDAIEVPFTDSIPSDYEGVMGVPISFLDKYSPEQFEIVGRCENEDLYQLKTKVYTSSECKQAYLDKFGKKGTYDMNSNGVLLIDGLLEKVYQRVLIKHRKATK